MERVLVRKELFTMDKLLHSDFLLGKLSMFICSREWGESRKREYVFAAVPQALQSPGAGAAASLSSPAQPAEVCRAGTA